MKGFQAVFFDYDNTLVDYLLADAMALSELANSLPGRIDSGPFIERAGEHIMAFHKLFELGLINPEKMHTYRLSNTLQDFGLDWDAAYLSRYINFYLDNHCVYPGAEAALRALSGTVKLGIVTNSYLVEEQKTRIVRSGLAKYFDDILVCASIGHYKPAPQAFLHLVHKYRLQPEHCLFVGDSEKYDILGAKNAGLSTVRIVHHEDKDISTAADYLCHGFTELSALLKLS